MEPVATFTAPPERFAAIKAEAFAFVEARAANGWELHRVHLRAENGQSVIDVFMAEPENDQ